MAEINSHDLYGSIVALATPMNQDGSINFKEWADLVRWHINCGSNGIVVAGTTGESALLSEDEFKSLLEQAVSLCADSKTLVIAGTGAIKPQQVIKYNKIAHELGADAALVVTPYYIRISQKALLNHFTFIANASPLPLIMYNVPSRTGIDIAATTSITLSNHNMIIGIKEAKADMERIKKLCTKKNFAVLSGDDDSFLEAMQIGAQGVISVAANIRPKTTKNICNYISLGDLPNAQKLNNEMKSTYQLLSVEPNPMPLKWIMNEAKMISTGIRKPLELMQPPQMAWKNELNKILMEFSKI